LLLWTLAVIVYGSFWFALAVVINSFGKASSWNATVLASCWLVLIVIIPASINLSATSFYPVPSRIEFVTAMRRESRQAELEGSRLLGKYFQDHPELAERKNELDSNKDDFAMLQLAKDDMVARQLEPVLRDFDSQLVSQNKLVNSFRFFSPAILMQAVLYDISGTGVVRYQSFIKQVEAFHTTWHNFFSSRIFEKRSLTRDDIKKFPTFTYDDETVSEIFGRVMTPILILLVTTIIIGSFGFNRYKNYSVAGY
ncbi:MAG: DUF3526 domain-containing protein, partial [Blastocatellia bacterium]|nr:DUF3526 domain-containing protein [Blastocatellia bacterium]